MQQSCIVVTTLCTPALVLMDCDCLSFLPWKPVHRSSRSTAHQAASCRICDLGRHRFHTWSPNSWTEHPARQWSSPGISLVFPGHSLTPSQMAPPGKQRAACQEDSSAADQYARHSGVFNKSQVAIPAPGMVRILSWGAHRVTGTSRRIEAHSYTVTTTLLDHGWMDWWRHPLSDTVSSLHNVQTATPFLICLSLFASGDNDVLSVFQPTCSLKTSPAAESSYFNDTYYEFLTNHTTGVGLHTRKTFFLDEMSRTSCENSHTRAAGKKNDTVLFLVFFLKFPLVCDGSFLLTLWDHLPVYS